jgi:hypothetical protein
LIEESGDYSSGAITLAKLSIAIALYKTITVLPPATSPLIYSETSVLETPTICIPNTITLVSTATYTYTTNTTITKTIVNTLTITTTIYGENITKYVYVVLGLLGILTIIALAIVVLISRKLK